MDFTVSIYHTTQKVIDKRQQRLSQCECIIRCSDALNLVEQMHVWQRSCFKEAGRPCALATFVDNLIVPAPSPQDAIAVQQDIEAHLARRWGLKIGAGSKELLICKGWKGSRAGLHGWQVCDNMKTLGHWLSNDGGYKKCFQETVGSMLRAFYCNVNAGLKRANKKSKLRFLTGCVLPIARSRWARWAYMPTFAAKINSLQRKMIASLFDIVPAAGEPYDAFCQRRHNLSGAIAKDMGLWSREWAHSLVNWAAHIDRGHDELTWSKHLLEWHGPDWLDWQRLLWSKPGRSITKTRCCAGTPAKRWLDGLKSAKHACADAGPRSLLYLSSAAPAATSVPASSVPAAPPWVRMPASFGGLS